MKYRRITLMVSEGHAVHTCCELLNVSSSGYYDWRDRLPSERSIENTRLKANIKRIHDTSKATYGSPRIRAELKNQGVKTGVNRVARLMREENLSGRKKKAYVPKTTINNPLDTKSERLFKVESTEVTAPNQVWASDLTYIPTDEGHAYLVVVLDLCTRAIKGWDFSDSMEAGQTLRAVTNAYRSSVGPLRGLIFHSDQGSQYCSDIVRERLALLGMEQSMSRRGNCYDNAFVESFFHTLKNELEQKKFKTKEEARKAIFEYIETWYNTNRLHSSLGYRSPAEFGQQFGYVA